MTNGSDESLGEDRYEKGMNMFLTRRITFKEFLDLDLPSTNQKIKELDEVILEDEAGAEREIDRMSTGNPEWDEL